jgi:hypothetical protein
MLTKEGWVKYVKDKGQLQSDIEDVARDQQA